MDAFYQFLQSFGYTHPIHPTLIYLPIGGVMAAFIFGFIAVFFNRSNYAISARHTITLAFTAVFPTILLGYMDWQYFHGGNWMFPIKMKIILAAVLVVLLSIALLMHWKKNAGTKAVLPIYALCFLNVVGIGYYGGEIVFGGAGRQQTPTEEKKAEDRQPKESVTFADVSPIFEQHCNMCHKGGSAPLGLQLDTYAHVMAGSENGDVVIPGKPGESELVLRIKGQSEPAMPFMQPALSEDKINTVDRWIEQGAPKGAGESGEKDEKK